MMKKLLAILLFSSATFANSMSPSFKVLDLAERINDGSSHFEFCQHFIESTPKLISRIDSCDVVASLSAEILELAVEILEYNELEVTKENRKQIPDIIWKDLNLFQFLYVTSVLLDGDVTEASEFIAENDQGMITTKLKPQTIEKLKKGKIL